MTKSFRFAGVLALVAVVTVTPSPAVADSPSERADRGAWSPYTKPVPSKFLEKAVLRTHVVRVVEVRTPRDSQDPPQDSMEQRRQEVTEGVRFLEEQLPGLKMVIRWEKPVQASAAACTSPMVAFEAAHKRVPEAQYVGRQGQHVAALVECATTGLALTAPARALGSGIIWAPWRMDVIAHELGHTLGFLGHSGSLDCQSRRVSPRTCNVDEYRDPFDLMGQYRPASIAGLWRDMVFGATSVPKGKPSTFRLQTPGDGRVAKPLRIKSRIGTIYLDLAPPGQFTSGPLVVVRLVVTHMQAPQQVILTPPVLPDANGENPIPGFDTDDRFPLPGTTLSVRIGAMTDTTAEVEFSPR